MTFKDESQAFLGQHGMAHAKQELELRLAGKLPRSHLDL